MLVFTCCRCSDCSCMLNHLSALLLLEARHPGGCCSNSRPYHAARPVLSHGCQWLTAHCGHSRPRLRGSGTRRQARATACGCMGLPQPSTVGEPAAGPLQPRGFTLSGITANWRVSAALAVLCSPAMQEADMSKPAWQEQPVRTLDMAKAAQPLRAAQVKGLEALHLNPAAALHSKQLQLRAAERQQAIGLSAQGIANRGAGIQPWMRAWCILLEGCMTAAAFQLQATKRMLHTCCATMSTSASSPMFTK